MQNTQGILDAPIPGQSLTTPVGANNLPGSAPYEKPPQFVHLNDALEFLWEKLTSPKQAKYLVLMLKKKIPAQYIAQTFLFEGAAKGTWNFDVAQLMAPTAVRMVVSIGALAGVKDMRIKTPDVQNKEFMSQFLDLLDEKEPEPEPKTEMFSGLMGEEDNG